MLFREPVLAAPSPSGRADGTEKITGKDYQHFKKCRTIRNRYDDGVPLTPGDHAVVLAALRRHPKAVQKIGKGVAAITVGRYVEGSRCFFVIRTDGSVEDFSLRACFSPSHAQRSKDKTVLAVMRAFDYRAITQKFQAALRHLPTSN